MTACRHVAVFSIKKQCLSIVGNEVWKNFRTFVIDNITIWKRLGDGSVRTIKSR